jgi:uncharacterized damage-inducible protein DinB
MAFYLWQMNNEILLITEQLKETYEGEPWFGRSVKNILSEIDGTIVVQKPDGQHSILELLWHMITWKEFTISRLRNDNSQTPEYFEQNDWRKLDHSDRALWEQGLRKFADLHKELVELIQQQQDELLINRVDGRDYDFRKLLSGVVQHDIYHLGQIAYIKKMLQK